MAPAERAGQALSRVLVHRLTVRDVQRLDA
jgi:hypothetical protein